MIPIKLSIKGLYSYQEKQTIDFTKLTSAHLFGIFGTVGSGKSTILEAITFALYGKTERLNLAGDNRNYNMMNLKSDELLIEFIFKTGSSAKEYQVLVRGKRNSKKFDDVKTFERTAYFKSGDSWEPISTDKIEAAIGLSYDNFKRTIIIPQGLFQEFLQLGQKDRSQMMKELFNLQKYELFYKVVALESRNNEKLQILEGRLKELGEIQPMVIEEKKVELAELQKIYNNLKEDLEKANRSKIGFEQLRDLHNRLTLLQQKMELLLSHQEEITLLEKQITEYEYCLFHFKPILDVLHDSEKRLQENTLEVNHCKTELEQVKQRIDTCLPILNTLKLEQDKRESKIQQADELIKMVQINKLQSELLILNKRIEEGEAYNSNFKNDVEQKKLTSQKIELQLKQLKSQRVDVTELTTAKEWYTQKIELQKQEQILINEINQLTQEQNSLKKEYDSFYNNEYNKLEFGRDEKLYQFLESDLLRIENELVETDNQIEYFSIQAKLAEYASNLHDGKPCPLCGSLEHPEIFNEAEAAKSLQNMRKLKDSMKQKVQWVSQLLQKISKNQIESQALQKKDADLKSKLALVQTQNKEHQQQFRWEKYPKIEILNEALSNMEAQEKKITATENQLEINAKEIEAELLKLHHYQQKLEELKHQLTDINSKYTTLKSQLSVIPYNQWSIKTSEFIEEEILRIRQNVVQMDAEYKVQQAQLDSLNKANESLNSKIALRTMDMQKEQQFIETKKSEFESLVHQSQFTGLAYILSVLAQPTDSANGKQRIESYNQQMAILQEQLKATRSEKGEKTYDAEAHKAFELEFEQLNETYATQNKLFINAESELVKLQNDLLKQQLLIKDREQLELRSADLKTLKQLFQGSKFVNYISTVHLQNLCKDANNRFFKLSGQKLSLEITEDNNFQVRDFMNDGKVRHVKTLSGGQTFQAALSLALALADSVQKNSASAENFFFLDEGFGSLDNESLQIVFDTLKTLRNENRIVGIISHVEELQQEIDTHIRVSNSENSGSFITPNY